MRRRYNPAIVFGVIEIILGLAVAGVVITILVLMLSREIQNKNTQTQVTGYIGYFDEDIPSSSDNELKPQSEKEVNENFIIASLNKEGSKVKEQKEKVKLSAVQKAVKKNTDLNDGEWLPPIVD